MTRAVLYMAHPVSPSAEELAAIPTETVEIGLGEYDEIIRYPLREDVRIAAAVKDNLDRALRWLSWLRRSFPETTFIAPWIAGVMSVGSDGTPEEREAGMLDCCAVVERCDGIVLVGGRISTGMRRELEHGIAYSDAVARYGCGCQGARFDVYDLIGMPADTPTQPAWFERTAAGRTFEIWIKQGCKIWELKNKR